MRCALTKLPPDVVCDVLPGFLPLRDLWTLTRVSRLTKPLFVRAGRKRLERRLLERKLKLPTHGILTGGFLVQLLLDLEWESGDIDVVCNDSEGEAAEYGNAIVQMNPPGWRAWVPGKGSLWKFLGFKFPLENVQESAHKNDCVTRIVRVINDDDKIDVIGRRTPHTGDEDAFAFLDDFDLSVCQCAYDISRKILFIKHPSHLFEMRGTFTKAQSERTQKRVQKYRERGFELVEENKKKQRTS